MTTFRPGTCRNHASRLCACWAAEDRPVPPCVRIVTGTLALPPNMYFTLAVWLAIWSMAIPEKSTYMSSATGRIPRSAEPSAAPMMAASEIGVFRTRSLPNSCRSPTVVL